LSAYERSAALDTLDGISEAARPVSERYPKLIVHTLKNEVGAAVAGDICEVHLSAYERSAVLDAFDGISEAARPVSERYPKLVVHTLENEVGAAVAGDVCEVHLSAYERSAVLDALDESSEAARPISERYPKLVVHTLENETGAAIAGDVCEVNRASRDQPNDGCRTPAPCFVCNILERLVINYTNTVPRKHGIPDRVGIYASGNRNSKLLGEPAQRTETA
jgi:hypothetical protein